MKKKDSNLAERWQEARGNLLLLISTAVLVVGFGIITIYRAVMVAGERSGSPWSRLQGVNDRAVGLGDLGDPQDDAADIRGFQVEFVVLGVRPSAGPVQVAIHRRAETFGNPELAVITEQIEASGASARWIAESLPGGPAAVTAFQDLNGDGQLNRDGGGRPVEPVGYSGLVGVDSEPSSSRPMFSEAAIEIDERTRQVVIELNASEP